MSEQSFKVDQVPDAVVVDQKTADDKDIVQVLSKRVDDSQKHITNMHQKLDKQNEVIQKQNELIEQLLAGAQNLAPNKQDDGSGNKSTEASTPSLKPEDVEKVVSAALERSQREAAAKQLEAARTKNFTDVAMELTKRYGNSVDEQVSKIAQENDMTYEEAVMLAKDKPKAFLKLFPKETPVVQQATRTGFNSVAVASMPTPEGKPADPQNLRSLMDRYQSLEKQIKARG